MVALLVELETLAVSKVSTVKGMSYFLTKSSFKMAIQEFILVFLKVD